MWREPSREWARCSPGSRSDRSHRRCEPRARTGAQNRPPPKYTRMYTRTRPEGARIGTLGQLCGLSALRSSEPQKRKNPCETLQIRDFAGVKAERLRSESNRRWRICNPLPDTDFPEENHVPGQVDPVVDPAAPAAPELAELAAAWSSLPTAIRAGILAMVRAAKG